MGDVIRVSTPESGVVVLGCQLCAWRSMWAVKPDLSLRKIIDDAMHHASAAHGIDEIRGETGPIRREFDR